MLGKSPIKWWQRPGKTIAVDWDVQHQLKNTNETFWNTLTCHWFELQASKVLFINSYWAYSTYSNPKTQLSCVMIAELISA